MKAHPDDLDLDWSDPESTDDGAPLTTRAFFAHSKSDNHDWIERCCLELEGALENVSCMPAHVDFKKRMRNEGSWDAWGNSVTGMGLLPSGDFGIRYELIIVPSTTTGRGTAAVVRGALARSIPVVMWEERTGVLRQVTEIRAVDADNWKSGWSLVVERNRWRR